MLCVGCDLSQRLQHEAAPMHCRMRQAEVGRRKNRIPEQQEVDVDNARAFRLRTLSSHFLLDLKHSREEISRRQIRTQRYSAIEEPGLRGELNGLSFIERGNGDYFAECGEFPNGGSKIVFAAADV